MWFCKVILQQINKDQNCKMLLNQIVHFSFICKGSTNDGNTARRFSKIVVKVKNYWTRSKNNRTV